MRRILALACLCAVLAGCGGSEHARVNPEAMLSSAARHPIGGAQVKLALTVHASGVPRLSGPVRLRLEGPYRGGARSLPRFDWRLAASALGFPVGGRLVSTGSNLYLSVYGDDYEFGSAAVAVANERLAAARAAGALPLRPRHWLGPARVVGDDSAGGVDCERIAAPLRGQAVARDLAPLAAALGVPAPSISGKATPCVGFDDRVLHGLGLNVLLRGAGSAGVVHLQADLELSDIGNPSGISAPRGAPRPIRDLLLTLNDLGVPIPVG